MSINLKAISEEIDTEINKEKEIADSAIEELTEKIADAVEEARIAASYGDLSENSAYDEALSNITNFNAQVARLTEQKEMLSAIGTLKYNSVGIVLVFSTVLLECEDGSTYIYKIFPGVSMGSRVISDESKIAKAILRRSKGDEVLVEHSISKRMIKYTIKDLY